jgi:hypothetical protein
VYRNIARARNDLQSTEFWRECDGVFRDFRRTFIRSGSTTKRRGRRDRRRRRRVEQDAQTSRSISHGKNEANNGGGKAI